MKVDVVFLILTLLFRYFIDANYAVIVGKPSAKLAEKLESEEKARLADQIDKLGPDGLARAEKDLEAAKAEHEKPIPKDVLTSFPVPDVKSISWIPVESVQETGQGLRVARGNPGKSLLARHIESDGSPLSMFVQYDHVQVRLRNGGAPLLIVSAVRFCLHSRMFLPGKTPR